MSTVSSIDFRYILSKLRSYELIRFIFSHWWFVIVYRQEIKLWWIYTDSSYITFPSLIIIHHLLPSTKPSYCTHKQNNISILRIYCFQSTENNSFKTPNICWQNQKNEYNIIWEGRCINWQKSIKRDLRKKYWISN